MLKPKLLTICLLLSLSYACKNSNTKDDDSVQKKEKDSIALSDEALMDTVQKQTLKYFWDYAEPSSGMARERYYPSGNYPKNDANIVTTGGSGFGLMAILVGIKRNFIPRDSAVARLDHIADFLASADRYHGAWSHWMNGETGKTKAFGKKDNGGDIVETAFMARRFNCGERIP